MRIGDVDVDEVPVLLVAEIGVNHFDIAEQRDIAPLAAAKEMVREAAEAGVGAVKFQSYTAEKLATEDSPAYWDTDEEATTSQFELFERYDDFGADEFGELAAYANERGVEFLSTPFDAGAVEYLDDLVPAFKVASADITNHPLLREIGARGKPVLLSTGASTVGEIADAVDVLRDEGDVLPIVLLHCVLDYPTDADDANLRMIEHLKRAFPGTLVGYSDHVLPDESMITLVNAYVKGARVIEKHFTLDKELPGNDHYHAMDPADVRTFMRNVELIERTNGLARKEPLPVEMDSRTYARRSLVAIRAIPRGEEITRDMIAIKRPGTGISPTMLDLVVGRTATERIEVDRVIQWDQI